MPVGLPRVPWCRSNTYMALSSKEVTPPKSKLNIKDVCRNPFTRAIYGIDLSCLGSSDGNQITIRRRQVHVIGAFCGVIIPTSLGHRISRAVTGRPPPEYVSITTFLRCIRQLFSTSTAPWSMLRGLGPIDGDLHIELAMNWP